MYAGFSGQFFFLSFPRKRLLGEKKNRCAVFGCNNDILVITFFSRNIQRSSLFARKARVNTERVPPGHPIILLKSNKFNMAAVSVKRPIILINLHPEDIAFPEPYSLDSALSSV